MSGYGIDPAGFGLDPYGDPIAITGILSANIYSIQPYLRARVDTESGELSVSGLDDMAAALALSGDDSLRDSCLLSVASITDENLLSAMGVN
jgi:hypothetical protein